MKGASFKIVAGIWIYPSEHARWHFVTVPKGESTKITDTFREFKRGWGSLPIEVTVGKTTWKTSIFPDSKMGTYILPIKATVRRAEGLEAGDKVQIRFKVMI